MQLYRVINTLPSKVPTIAILTIATGFVSFLRAAAIQARCSNSAGKYILHTLCTVYPLRGCRQLVPCMHMPSPRLRSYRPWKYFDTYQSAASRLSQACHFLNKALKSKNAKNIVYYYQIAQHHMARVRGYRLAGYVSAARTYQRYLEAEERLARLIQRPSVQEFLWPEQKNTP